MPLRPLPALLCLLALAGCGSAPSGALPPAASLPAAPPPIAKPEGRVRPAGAPLPDPGTATAAGRTFTVDRHANELRVEEDGREVRRLPTGLEPAAVAVAGKGTQVAVLSVRGRVLELFEARSLRRIGPRANAGAGPALVASNGDTYLYVTDAIGGSVLVFHTIPELALVRRYGLPGGPWAIAYDPLRDRLWVTLAGVNRVAELTTGRRIRRLADHAALRQPSAVAVDEASGTISVTGQEQGVVQLLDPPRSR